MSFHRTWSRWLTPVILIAALVAVGAWAIRVSAVKRKRAEREEEQKAIATTRVRKGAFEVVVEGIGMVDAVSSRPVTAQVSGQILALVPNGVEVEKGDVIAQLDVPRMVRQLRDQTVRYEQALDDLQQKKRSLAAGVERVRISLEQAEKELERFRAEQEAELTDKRTQREHDAGELALMRERFQRKQRLAKEGLIPQREVELATAELKAKEFDVERQTKDLELAEARKSSGELNKEAAVNKARSDLARAESAEQDEIQNAKMRLKVREQQLARVQDQLDQAMIQAPAAGIVVLAEQRQGMSRRPLEPGDQVWRGRRVATLPDLSKMRAILEVPQKQARQIRKKQSAVIRVEALPEMEFDGEVTEVAQTGSEGTFQGTGISSDEKIFKTMVQIKDTKGAPLRPGMTAQVRIIVEKVPNAVRVPLECVFDRDGRKVVYVKRGTRFEEVEVKLGQQNADEAVVKSGLKGGEEITLRDIGSPGATTTGGDENLPSVLPL